MNVLLQTGCAWLCRGAEVELVRIMIIITTQKIFKIGNSSSLSSSLRLPGLAYFGIQHCLLACVFLEQCLAVRARPGSFITKLAFFGLTKGHPLDTLTDMYKEP